MQDRAGRCARLGTRPSQRHLSAGHDLQWPERLGNIVVGPQPEAVQHVGFQGAGGQQQDRHVALFTDQLQHLEVGELRQHHVEQQQIGRVLPE